MTFKDNFMEIANSEEMAIKGVIDQIWETYDED